MRKILLLSAALLTFYLIPTSASAQVVSHTPPTPECLKLAKSNLEDLIGNEQRVYVRLAEAGCLSSDRTEPAKTDVNGEQCTALRQQVAGYMAPYLSVVGPITKRLRTIAARDTARVNKLHARWMKLMDADRKPALQAALNSKFRRIMRESRAQFREIIANNRPLLADTTARGYLSSFDIITNRCRVPSQASRRLLSVAYIGLAMFNTNLMYSFWGYRLDREVGNRL